MPAQDQLEIISPDGEIEFYDLDPARGVTNIGRHPANDIVIESEGVAPFHAVLDHRRKPYSILLLSQDGPATLGGAPLSRDVAQELHSWDTIQLDGYALILLESGEAAAGLAPAAAPLALSAASPIEVSAPGDGIRFTAAPADRLDDIIVVDLSAREWVIDVDEQATCQVTIVNGGPIVASFQVDVHGLDSSWVTIAPRQVNLYEGERATVQITIQPPRAPTSQAGAHYLAVVVTSPNYSDRSSQQGALLTLNPYYDFAIGELVPKQQTITWFKRSGEATVPVVNRGNSLTTFRLEGSDDERKCSFEFLVPGEEVSLAKQADIRLHPEEAVSVGVRITPITRRLISLRKATYPFTITTTMLEGQQTPRALMGQLSSAPLIGAGTLTLIFLSLVALIVLIFRPAISEFQVEPAQIRAGESVTLRWRASPFSSVRIEPNVGVLEQAAGTATDSPKDSVTYKLTAENWLSRLNPIFLVAREQKVEVEPVLPVIRNFVARPEGILRGEGTTLSWEVVGADELVLTADGISQIIPPEQHTGNLEVAPEKPTTYQLSATNHYGPAQQAVTVNVVEPSPTPVPTPAVQLFSISPLSIVEGQSVTIEWQVEGADQVSIVPIGDQLPPTNRISHSPQTTTNYVLTASNGEAAIQPRQLQVQVTPAPTGTPVPEKPVIDSFDIAPKEIVRGDPEGAQLVWAVSGETTNIEISGPDFTKVSNLTPQGNIKVEPTKTTFYVITAFNGPDLSVSKMVEVQVIEPTPTPTVTPLPSPTPAPPPTATPHPKPIISYFLIEGEKVAFRGGDPATYEVQAGSTVTLRWDVKEADKVSLLNFGDKAPTDQQTVQVLQSQTFLLQAENAGGTVTESIVVNMTAQPVPPPPSGLSGSKAEDGLKLDWQYDPAEEENIEGFRVYRGDFPPGTNFSKVHEILDPAVRSWTDTAQPTCAKAYYVVAIYRDIADGNKIKETDASTNSWYTDPCPPPPSPTP